MDVARVLPFPPRNVNNQVTLPALFGQVTQEGEPEEWIQVSARPSVRRASYLRLARAQVTVCASIISPLHSLFVDVLPVDLLHATTLTTPTTPARCRWRRRRHAIALPVMSGKSTPRGPRAHLVPLHTPAPPMWVPSALTPPGSSSSNIGARLPKGMRGLLNDVSHSQPPTEPVIDGYPPTSPGVILAPLAPSSSKKRKQVGSGWSTSDVGMNNDNGNASTAKRPVWFPSIWVPKSRLCL